MADSVLGSISIVITGDTSQLDAAFARAVAGAQSAGATISASVNSGISGADQLTIAIGRLAGTIERESAAASLAMQRNLAMQQSLTGAAQGAREFGEAANQSGYGLRYLIFGLKDIGEGRYRFALAELVNVVLRMGPAAIAAGAAIGIIGGSIYGIIKLNQYMRDLPDATRAAAAPFKELNDDLLKSNDEMQVANDQLANELAKLQGRPENGLKLALDEAVVSADELNAALHRDLQALQELVEKKEITSVKGFFTFETPTTDLKKKIEKFNLDIADATREGSAKIREAALLGNKTAEDAARTSLNSELIRRYTAEIKALTPEMENLRRAGMGGLNVFERIDALLQKGPRALHLEPVPPSTVEAVMQYQQAIANLGNELDAVSLRAEHDKLKPQVDTAKIDKEGADQARSLAVARLQAQQKELEEESSLEKRYSDSQIQVSHAIVESQIAAMTDRRAIALATAEEELRVAKANQAQVTADHAQNTAARVALIRQEAAEEGRGKTGTERQTIGVKAEEQVTTVQTKAAEEESQSAVAVRTAQIHVESVQITNAKELELLREEEISRQLDLQDEIEERRVQLAYELNEIKEKGSGQEAELKATHDKIVAEREYSTEAGHTYQEQITYATKIAEIEERARQAKIAGVQRDLAQAQAGAKDQTLTQPARDEQAKRAAQLQVQIAELQQQSDNANYEAQTKILEKILAQNQALQAQITILDALTNWSQISVGTAANQFAQTLVALPQQIGDSLAASIFTAPKKGETKGEEVEKGLVKTVEKSGEQLAGKLITDAIEKLIAQLIGQAALDALKNSVTAANTAALAALTAAITGKAVVGAATLATSANGLPISSSNIPGTLPGGGVQGGGVLGTNVGAAGGLGGVLQRVGLEKPGQGTGAGAGISGEQTQVERDNTEQLRQLSQRIQQLIQRIQDNSQQTSQNTGAIQQETTSTDEDVSELTQNVSGLTSNTSATSSNTIAVLLNTFVPKPFGFASGGNPDPSRPFIAGERGAELVHPRGQSLTVHSASETSRIMGYASGGDPGPNTPFAAGEKGAEIVHPKGQSPNASKLLGLQASGGYDTSSLSAPPAAPIPASSSAAAKAVMQNAVTTNANSSTMGDAHFHIYGATDPREVTRQVANHLRLSTNLGGVLNSQ